MRRLAELFDALDATTSTDAKVEALAAYFAAAPAQDAAWAVALLSGAKPRQVVPTGVLREVATRWAGLPEWLFEESYQAVGDLAETIAHVLPPPARPTERGLAAWMNEHLLPARDLPAEARAQALAGWLDELDAKGRFLLIKLIGGGFRVGVSRVLVQRALARHAGLDAKLVAERMMGRFDGRRAPVAADLEALLAPAQANTRDGGQPYPFFLAQALPADDVDMLARLGARADWLVEWKYDGIRAQIVRREEGVWIWSRGEELVTDRYPEVAACAARLPTGTVLDGELLAWEADADRPAAFAQLQRRIGRKTIGRRLLAEVPVRFLAYDLLEAAGSDVREQPQAQRRAGLEALLAQGPFAVSPRVAGDTWDALRAQRSRSRALGMEGLMLKHLGAPYGSGRTTGGAPHGTWWKWKVEPMVADLVLIYAQAGHGRRAGVYTDYTFAAWSRPPGDAAEAQSVVDAIARGEPARPEALQLVPVAKAYSGLSDAEFRRVDQVIRATTREKFGPVRSVVPSLVFELGFEGIGPSPRHKSGIAVRFPRMLRIRDDKPLHEADTLASLRQLMPSPR